MREPRRQLRLAQEALQQVVSGALSIAQHLDDNLAAERRLLAAVHSTETTLADQLADDEISDVSPEQPILVVCHLQGNTTPANKRLLVCI
ncbi:MAG TPA: hypothetical protein VHN14_19150 [Kofleriaceae bacterium]|nr:hypothetical protein [Kofleriaceae bacterium]